MTVPIISDVDAGMDDALALGLAALNPKIELVAATTVAGNVGIGHTTPKTLTVLDWCGATDVPVYRGTSRPLARPLVTTAQCHGGDGLGEAGLEPSRREIGAQSRPAAMVRLGQGKAGRARSRRCASGR